jgi:hypothetical protein
MFVRRLSFLCVVSALTSALVAVVGCADEDPRFGGAGAIQNVQVFPPAAAPVVEGGAALTPIQAFAQVLTALRPCGNCHAPPGAAGAPLFFGADEAASYDLFKLRNYHLEGGKPATSMYGLVERGQHAGLALTAAQLSTITQWRAAEKAASTAPSDGGTGGGG